MGAPGSGKGTISKLLAKHFGIPHISRGAMIREAISIAKQQGVSIYKSAENYMAKGLMIPWDLVKQLYSEIGKDGKIQDRLIESDCKNGFILDGIFKIDTITNLKECGIILTAILYIDVDRDILVERLGGRRVCNKCDSIYHIKFHPPKMRCRCDYCGEKLFQRIDDIDISINTRLELFQNQFSAYITELKEKGLLLNINGNQNVDDILIEIINCIEIANTYRNSSYRI